MGFTRTEVPGSGVRATLPSSDCVGEYATDTGLGHAANSSVRCSNGVASSVHRRLLAFKLAIFTPPTLLLRSEIGRASIVPIATLLLSGRVVSCEETTSGSCRRDSV